MVMFFYELIISIKNTVSNYLGRPDPAPGSCLRRTSYKNAQPSAAATTATASTAAGKKYINVAVTGPIGCGKTTLINAMLGIEDEAEALLPAAGCNALPRSYLYPSNSAVLLWDLPGIEASEIKQQAYLEKTDLRSYDFFILVSGSKVGEEVLYLAKEIERMSKRFYFVRTKIDVYVRNTKQENFNQGDLLREIRKHFRKRLQGIGIKFPHIYLISAQQTDKFDFQDFVEDFNDAL